MKCQVCGEGNLAAVQKLRNMEYGGRVGTVALYFSVCDHCGSQIAGEEESVLNRRAVNRFKKQIDGVPLGSQIRAMRKAAKLTQAQAGALLGGGPVAFSKYETDDLIPDNAMANLLRLAIADASVISVLRTLRSASTTAIRTYQIPNLATASASWHYQGGIDDSESVSGNELTSDQKLSFDDSTEPSITWQ